MRLKVRPVAKENALPQRRGDRRETSALSQRSLRLCGEASIFHLHIRPPSRCSRL